MEPAIINKALELGFAAAGGVPAGPSQSQAVFEKWLASGRAAEMQYLFRHAALRQHPDRLLPDVRVVFIVAARYLPGVPGDHYAGYACRPDYHGVMRARLRQLGEYIRDQTGGRARFRVCVDSAPLPEREWALRAGLGWRGRQGALVHPRWGCCLFLGAVLTDWPASGDIQDARNAPAEDMRNPSEYCGDCRMCVSACPNGAIGPDGLVDARRCAAYWTVEHREIIPRAQAGLVGQRLFGCDCCTAVCPRNPARADTAGIPPDFIHGNIEPPGPAACLALSESEFLAIFRGTPVMRLGRERLQRNAVVVLFNQGRRLPPGGPDTLAPLAKRQVEELKSNPKP